MNCFLKSKLTLTLVLVATLVATTSYAVPNDSDHTSKSINFDRIFASHNKKLKFRIKTVAGKEDVHLEFEATKLTGGKYAIYKTDKCDLKNFSSEKLKKISPKNLFFAFTTNSGNIFEERKIDHAVAAKFNIGVYSFVLVKIGNVKTAIACSSPSS